MTETTAQPVQLVPLLTAEQVADHLHLSVRTVHAMLKAGQLRPAARTPAGWRVPVPTLAAYVERYTVDDVDDQGAVDDDTPAA